MGERDDGVSPDRCPECRGRGWIVLLVHRSECSECSGTGIVAGRFDDEGGDEGGVGLEFDDQDTPPHGTPRRRS